MIDDIGKKIKKLRTNKKLNFKGIKRKNKSFNRFFITVRKRSNNCSYRFFN